VYFLAASGLLLLIRTTSSTILSYTDATVASSTGINGQLRQRWTQQEDSPQADETHLRRHSLVTPGILVEVLARTARLSSRGLSQTDNLYSPRLYFLALGKAHKLCPAILHHNHRMWFQEYHSIRRHREPHTMDEGLAVTDSAKHPCTGRIPGKIYHNILLTPDVIRRGRTKLVDSADEGARRCTTSGL
jgi:hypothetical protein